MFAFDIKKTVVAGLVTIAGFGASLAQAENIKLRIASGHPAANTYVNLMQTFFAPEVTKREIGRAHV